MNRTLSYTGWAMMAVGLAILAYVGITLATKHQATTHTWTKQQAKQAQTIALNLGKHKVQRSHNAPKVAAGSQPATHIDIPAIDVNAPIVQTAPVGGVWQVADWAVGHLTSTPNPGAKGNMALSAHDDIKGEIFKRVGQLRPGTPMEIYTTSAKYTYVVTGQQAVDPSDVAVLDPTSKATVTLISCSPYWVDTQRLVIRGVLKSISRA
ncbi:MAG: sortase [Chloroflexota bacterium]